MSGLEDRMSLGEVAKELGVHVATVWRWVLKGVRGRRLRSVMVGGRRWVLRADLKDFLRSDDASTEASTCRPEAAAAAALLTAMGVR